MRKIAVFGRQLVEIRIGKGSLAVAFGNGLRVEKTGLSHEYSLYLKLIVAMMCHCFERNSLCPRLEGVAVDTESVVAGKRPEVSVLPRAVAIGHTPSYRHSLLFKAFSLQRAHPRMNHDAFQFRNDTMAWRIMVFGEQLAIIFGHRNRHFEPHLRQRLAVGSAHFGVYRLCDVQYHIIIPLVPVVPVGVPVGRLAVYLNVAHPHFATNLNLRVEEIRPGVAVGESHIYHLNGLSFGRSQLREREHLVFPDVME